MFNRLKTWLIRKVLLGTVRKCAEGAYGKIPQKVYWWLAGKKTYSGVVLLAAVYVLHKAVADGVCDATCTDIANTILVPVGGFLVAAGLLDDAWRDEPPRPSIEAPRKPR
jgi:hypothetical protein